MLLAALLSLATAASSASAGQEVLARVDAITVTRADLDERMRVLGQARRAGAPEQALSDLVDEALLAAEARRLGLHATPEVEEDVARERRRLAGAAFLSTAADSLKPSEPQLRELYHLAADQVRLTLVKVATEAEARGIVERVRGGGDLAAEARGSIDPALAARKGDTGRVPRGNLDRALADAAFAAKPGDLVGPVKLQLGWAVARVVEREAAPEAGFAAKRPELEATSRASAMAELRAHLGQQLRRASGVKLDEDFLRGLGTRIDVTRQELDHPIATVDGKPIPYRAIHPEAVQLFRAVRGHGAGATARIELAWREIDGRLLAREAAAKGLDRGPAVQAVLPGIERHLLAGALAARIGRTADLRDPAVRAKLAELRAGAKVELHPERVRREARR